MFETAYCRFQPWLSVCHNLYIRGDAELPHQGINFEIASGEKREGSAL